MHPALTVVRPGLFDTLQDVGRIGFLELGMPVAGAMDPVGLRLANTLAGNAAGTAAIEIGVMGPEIRVDADSARLAVTGPIEVALIATDQAAPVALPSDRSYLLTRGQRLRLGMVEGVNTAYLAIEGGLSLPSFMGSLATYTRAALGGIDGRKLAAGDLLPLILPAASRRDEQKLSRPFDYGDGPIRVVMGPQADYFSDAGIASFLGGEYAVTKEADRMGIRFEGPRIEHAKGWDIISDGIAYGAIQVPGAGQPIVLLADRQTIGGYPKIACVASADLPRLSRMLPGQKVRFQAVGVAEAEELRRELEKRIQSAIAAIVTARPPGGIDLAALYETNLISGVVPPA
jgi:allophanate hydrolase